ncbi:MAG: M56 family metallopeptidase [Bacteroidetes bacterium]|nr:M56 family metallopeptidase [Bacteroidota bacterium]
MLYLAQVILYTGILYMVYMLLLRNKAMHHFNRVYLLTISVLPVLLPFIQLPSLSKKVEQDSLYVQLPEAIAGVAKQTNIYETINWLLVGYMAVVVLMLLVFTRKWLQLKRVINKATAIVEEDYTILLNTGYGPGSWMHYILLPAEDIEATVIKHEVAHVRLKHSTDIVFLNIVQCLLWPNLILQAIKKELKQIHEFQADAAVEMDRQEYGQLLLSETFGSCTLPLTHSFIIHPIRRRIMMLNKRKNSPLGIAMGIVAVVATLILTFNIIMLQSCNKTSSYIVRGDEIKTLDQYPQMPDAIEWNDYIGKHLKYPEQARKNKMEGRVRLRFIIDEKGDIINPTIISCTDSIFCKPALDVMYGMPRWKPGVKNGQKVAVEYVQPFRFTLGKEKNPSTSIQMSNPEGDGETGKAEEKEFEKIRKEYEKVQHTNLAKYQRDIEKKIEEVKNDPNTIKHGTCDNNADEKPKQDYSKNVRRDANGKIIGVTLRVGADKTRNINSEADKMDYIQEVMKKTETLLDSGVPIPAKDMSKEEFDAFMEKAIAQKKAKESGKVMSKEEMEKLSKDNFEAELYEQASGQPE